MERRRTYEATYTSDVAGTLRRALVHLSGGAAADMGRALREPLLPRSGWSPAPTEQLDQHGDACIEIGGQKRDVPFVTANDAFIERARADRDSFFVAVVDGSPEAS